ncbi:MAG: pantoate--beta-alanine ligase [Gammaproteobacteria bacterium]|jgi:pantoate--beta-alanine ligase
MLVIDSVKLLREHTNIWRRTGDTIAFVPTMGNLHEGHLKLVDAADGQADKVVCSIFVNPLQFAPGSDFESYPRTLQQDIEKLKAHRVDLLFCPGDKIIYPDGMAASTKVTVPGLSDILCGASRPGHFEGVTTVVAKLFNLVQPDVAVFGEKDYQQLLIIKRMVDDLFLPVRIMGIETSREADGLAMSSRNNYLSDDERRAASVLYETLQRVAGQLGQQGQITSEAIQTLETDAIERLKDAGFKPDYVRICDAETLSSPKDTNHRSLRVLAAAWLGKARLIDNVPVK